MRIKSPDKIRVFLSRKYLDWAIKFPKIGTKFIPEIKEIYSHLIKTSEEEYERSRPPNGTEIVYLYFRLMELFHIEEFKSLQEGLIKLFPGIESSYRREDFSTSFRRFSESISSGGIYYSLGIIYREKGSGFLPKAFREIKSLPHEIEHINVSYQKILPSLIVVSLHVYLTKEAIETLRNLQQGRYFRRVRFKSLVPWRLSGYRFSQESVDNVKSEKLLSWLGNLRLRIEENIKPYICGYFLKQDLVQTSRLPVIEIYGLKGLPVKEEDFRTWHKEARNWWKSLGFNFFWDVYGNRKLLFTWPGAFKHQGSNAYRCVVLWQAYIDSLDRNNFCNDKLATAFALDAFLPCIVLIEFYKAAKRNVEELRRSVFESMKRRRFFRFRLNKLINLNNTVMHELMVQERISMEFNESRNEIQDEMRSYDDIVKIKLDTDEKGGQCLRAELMNRVVFHIARLNKHFSLIKKSFSEFLSLRNMEALFALQRRIFWLAITVAVITLIGVFISLERSHSLISEIIQWILSIINER